MASTSKEDKITGAGVVGSSMPGEGGAFAQILPPSLSSNCARERVVTQTCPPEDTTDSDDTTTAFDQEAVMTWSENDSDVAGPRKSTTRRRKIKKSGKRSLSTSPERSGKLINKRKHTESARRNSEEDEEEFLHDPEVDRPLPSRRSKLLQASEDLSIGIQNMSTADIISVIIEKNERL